MLLAIIIGHVAVTPYTKVEETFQVNNIYDHIYLLDDIQNYDFQEFPGVVDRTFLSSLLVSVFAFPFKYLLSALGLSCFYMLHICKIRILLTSKLARIVLGIMNFAALKVLRNSIMTVYKDKELHKAFFIVMYYQFIF
jgi:alpha-1,6-mannosyltransferase